MNAQDALGVHPGRLINGTTFAPGMVGYGVSFDGIDDSVAFDSVGNFGDDDFTIEFWVQTSSTAPLQSLISKRFDCGLSSYLDIRLGTGDPGGGGVVSVALNENIQGHNRNVLRSSSRVNDGVFHHVALVREGAMALLYVDGTLEASNSTVGITLLSNTASFVVGRSPCVGQDSTRYFKGVVDELSLYACALRREEIAAIHAAGRTGKCLDHFPECVLPAGITSWWEAETNALDRVGFQDGELLNGTKLAPGKVGQAFSFDGKNNFVRFGPAAGDFGYDDFTVEFWFRTTSTAGYQTLFSKRVSCTEANFFQMALGNGQADGNGKLFVVLNEDASTGKRSVLRSSMKLNDGIFHHVAVCRRGVAAFLYVEGALEDSNSTDSITFVSNTADLLIGRSQCGNSPGYYNGLLDELSLYNRALTPVEIMAIYLADSAGKCPAEMPPPPCANGSGLVSWWQAESNALDNVGDNHGVASGGVHFSNGLVGTAFDFNGTSGRIDLGDPDSLAFTNSFTIEGWLRHEGALDKTEVILFRGSSLWRNDPYSLALLADGSLKFNIEGVPGSEWQALETAPLPWDRWHHAAAVFDRDAGRMRLFTNGLLAAEVATYLHPFRDLPAGVSAGVSIGNKEPGNDSAGFDGLIDELAVYGRALSEHEIAVIYLADRTGKCSPGPPCALPAPDGIVGWWKGESDLRNSAGLKDGAVFGANLFGPGLVGQAFSFDGISESVTFGTSAGNFGSNDFTIEFWAQTTSRTPRQSLVSKRSTCGASSHFDIQLGTGTVGQEGIVNVLMNGGAGDLNPNELLSSTEINDGQFHHVAVNRQGVTAFLYVDGVLEASHSTAGITLISNAASLAAGWSPCVEAGSASYFDGSLDELSLYERALSSAEIAAIHEAGSAGKCPLEPPDIVSQTEAVTVSEGSTARFAVDVRGAEPIRYQWFHDWIMLPAQTQPELVVTNVRLIEGGDYWVAITNGGGTVGSSAATLTVIPRIDVEWLLNIEFRSQEVSGESRRVGPAAAGQADSDFWNIITNDGGGVDTTSDTFGTLLLADGSPAGVALSAANLTGGGKTASEDEMYGHFVSAPGGAPVILTFTNLPPGPLDFYAFSPKGDYELLVDGVSRGVRQCREWPIVNPTIWQEGVQYALFRGIHIEPGQEVTLIARAGLDHPASISGLQIGGPTPPSPCALPAPPNLVSWWTAESNSMDTIGPSDGSLKNGAHYVPGKVGTAFGFDGVDDWLSIALSPTLDIGAGTGLTIEFWLQPQDASVRSELLTWAASGIGGVTMWTSVAELGGGPGSLFANVRGSSGNHKLSTEPGVLTSGVFQHVALTYERASGLACIYVNGVVVTNAELGSFTPNTPTVYGLYVGGRGTTNGAYGGSLDELSLYNRALTPSEIAAIHKAGEKGKCPLEPPQAPCPMLPGIVSWWQGETNTVDSVGVNNADPRNGVGFAPGKVGQAFRFDGLDDWLLVPATSSLQLGTGEGLTIEAWVLPVDPTKQAPIVEWWHSLWHGASLMISVPRAGGGPGSVYLDLYSKQLSTRPGMLKRETFQHVAATYDKRSGVAAIYVDGILMTNALLGSFNPATRADLYVGREITTSVTSRYYEGLLDELALHDRALSAAEVAAIYQAGSAGRCFATCFPPVIAGHPVDIPANEGDPAQLNVVAGGSPVLHYQWLVGGVPVPNATNASLAFDTVQTGDRGTYSVVVSNLCGAVTSSNAVLTVNRPPVADASNTATEVISPNGTTATVALDGSRSFDPDDDPLGFEWFSEPDNGFRIPIGTGIVAIVTLPVGEAQVELVVSDGKASDTNSVSIEVITLCEAVERLVMNVTDSGAGHGQSLVASLQAALGSIDRDNLISAIDQLRAFQHKVSAQVARDRPDLAEGFVQQAQRIINSLANNELGPCNLRALVNHDKGGVQLKFNGSPRRVHVIEASTDMVHWRGIGTARHEGDGAFEFSDQHTDDRPCRFYRVVTP